MYNRHTCETPEVTSRSKICLPTTRILVCVACGAPFSCVLRFQAQVNAGAVLGRLFGAVRKKEEGQNIVDVTTNVELLSAFWEAEEVHSDIRISN